jgi:ribonuclease HI
MKKENMKKEKLEIYTDASIRYGKIGIGYLVIDEKEQEKTFHTCITKSHLKNFSTNTGTFSAECYAIIRSILDNTEKDLVIYTDNSGVFENFYNNKNKHLIIRHLKEITKDRNIEIRWVPGHSNIYGNEIADKLSKEFHKQIQVKKELPVSSKKRKLIKRRIKLCEEILSDIDKTYLQISKDLKRGKHWVPSTMSIIRKELIKDGFDKEKMNKEYVAEKYLEKYQ